MEFVVKKQSSFKDVQRFKEIGSILKVEFELAEKFFFALREKTIDQNYQKMMAEIEADEDDFNDYEFKKPITKERIA